MLEGGCVYFKCVTVHLEKKMSRVELRIANTDKGRPRTGHEGAEGEWRYSSTLSLPSALDGVGGQLHASARFTPREREPVPTVQEAGWAPGPGWMGAENVASAGIRYPDRQDCSESLFSRNM
jgi:hypothetical protein